MKFCYPIRDTNGKELSSLDEVMRLIDDEAYGTWLLGANGLWHGGIHISDVSNPFSALNPDAVNTGEPVPLQFMADGIIVAYRINKEYLTAPYCGQQLRYSSSFVLVKSQCKPDPQKEKSWLEFYSLYMHLAPVADYPKSPCYKVRDGHRGILLRQYKNGQNGLPEGEPDKGESGAYPAPAKTQKSLKAGDRFVSSRTGRFYITKSGKATLTTFGLVRLLEDNVPGKEQYWVTLDPELMEPDGEIQGLMPGWMQRAKQKGAFDSVELTGETEEWKVSAGTPVGFMGCTESPGEGSKLVDKEWFVHLEVLSADLNMPGFLANPECVKGDKRSVLVPKGKSLFIRQDETGQPAFIPTSARLSAQCVLSRESTIPVADESQQWWYKVSGSGWLPQSDVEDVNQYDLQKLGFQALEENSGSDVMESPYEGWVPQAFGAISQSAEQGAGYRYGLVPQFYRDLMAEIDSNKDGKVTAEEIRQALAVRDPLVKSVVNRLVVKHHSEWCKGRSTGRWEGFYKDLDPLEAKYCEKWQTDLEWMSKVPPFDKDEAVWHFHPVVFLDAIKGASEFEITVELIETLLGHTRPWFTGKSGGKTFADNFKDNYPNVYQFDKQSFVNLLNNELTANGITEPYHKAHFLSQCLHESAHLDTTLEFSSGRSYDPGRHKDAIKNGNTVVGDGPKYKGRGLIQLTWKNNYKRFSTFSGVNCVLDSELIASDMGNAIKASCWYWRNNGTVHEKHSAKGDINVLIDNEKNNVELITLAVNGGRNGLSERIIYFNAIKKEWGLM